MTDLADAHTLKPTDKELIPALKTLLPSQAYPPRIESSCLLPVEILTTRFLRCPSSIAVMKPVVVGCHGSALAYACDKCGVNSGIRTGRKAYLAFSNRLLDLLYFHLAEPLDFEKRAASCSMHGLEREMISSCVGRPCSG